ncbi:MAG: indole-3-glycerol phosphate synthase TrpC [Candidatus Stahlbacteria bacterium]|nr:indole-3-glycerol phosphate synthase TrpC [Candidatus Stahlbacteria bacterium]
MSLLEELVKSRKEEVEEEKNMLNLKLLKSQVSALPPTRDFKRAIAGKGVSLIAEIKKTSPSKGVLRQEFSPKSIGKIYEENGASAISVLVPRKYFMGDPSYISEAKSCSNLPVLQKDFVTEEYQIYKARYDGADAILLITTIVEDLENFILIAHNIGMKCLVEIHNQKELEKALSSSAEIIGINNRNLETMEVNIERTFELKKLIPNDRIVVSESGIRSRGDIKRLEDIGISAVLVGEALMTSKDIGAKVRELTGKER